MTSTDICSIIEACGLSGVRYFEYGDIYIDFNELPAESVVVAKDTPVSYDIVEDIMEDEPDDELDNLLFEDPELWDELERKKVSGDFNE